MNPTTSTDNPSTDTTDKPRLNLSSDDIKRMALESSVPRTAPVDPLLALRRNFTTALLMKGFRTGSRVVAGSPISPSEKARRRAANRVARKSRKENR